MYEIIAQCSPTFSNRVYTSDKIDFFNNKIRNSNKFCTPSFVK